MTKEYIHLAEALGYWPDRFKHPDKEIRHKAINNLITNVNKALKGKAKRYVFNKKKEDIHLLVCV